MKRFLCLWVLFLALLPPSLAQTKKISLDTVRITIVDTNGSKNFSFNLNHTDETGLSTIDWGDGSTSAAYGNDNRGFPHDYSKDSPDTIEVRIYGNRGRISTLNLDYVDQYHKVIHLDVSKSTALTSLTCLHHQLTSLDVSKNTALTSLACVSNKLTSLDVSKNTALTSLNCGYNKLTSLDVSKNTALTSLDCSDNQLSSLDVSKNTALTGLDCSCNCIPLSTLYNLYNQHSYEYFSTKEQRDSIVLLVGEELDLSSERRIGQGVSTYKMTDLYGSEIHASDMWEEKGFVFRFNEPYTYRLEIKNPEPAVWYSSFTYYISVVGELPADYFSIQTRPNNTDWGTVVMTGNGRYKDGAEVTIIASAKTGYRFVNWTKEDGSVFATEAVHTFAVTENMDLTANFEEIPEEEESFAIGLLSNNPEWGLVSQLGTGSYKEDEEATIIATPNAGYRFVNWTKEDETVFSTEAVHTFKVKENLELMANFEKLSEEVESFTLSLSSNNPAWGNVFQSGEGRYEEGEEATVIAAANAGYRFVNWTKKDGSVFSTKAVHTFAVMENLELTANFEQGVGNENSREADFYIYTQGHTIYLSCGMGTIQVYDATGTLVYNGQSTAIPVQHSGMYIVKVGERSFKTIVR